MTNHIITGRQIQCVIIMFWGGSLVIITASSAAKQDVWISILMGTLMILPTIAIYCRILKLYPGLNLFEAMEKICGKAIGKIFSFIYILYALHLCTMVVDTFSQFIHILNTPETPKSFTSGILVALAAWSAKKGPENIARVAKFTWPILFYSTVITIIIGLKSMDINNLFPVMETDMKALLNGAFSYYALPLGEAVICLSFFSAVDKNTKASRIFLKSLFWFISLLLAIAFRNIMILGFPTDNQFYFPSYAAVSIISLGEFFTRIEVLIGINLVLAGFLKVCACLYCSSLGLTKLFNFPEQKYMVIPCALIVFSFSGLVSQTSLKHAEFLSYYPIYALPVEIILPVMIWIVAEIRNKVENGGKNKNQDLTQSSNPT